MWDRAGRWATVQVGMLGRSVAEVARELGCHRHTVNDTVVSYGTALVDDPARIAVTTALGLDETLFVRRGEWHRQEFVTSIVDVSPGRTAQLLDVVEGRKAVPATAWINGRPSAWREGIAWGCLDLSGPYRKVFDDALPNTAQVADPFHVIKVANRQTRRVPPESPKRDFRTQGPQNRPAV